MEPYMELDKKTTILLTTRLHGQLARLARRRGISLGELIRRACEREYELAGGPERQLALEALKAMRLPVGDVKTMKEESIEALKELF